MFDFEFAFAGGKKATKSVTDSIGVGMNLLKVTFTLVIVFVFSFAARVEAQDAKRIHRVGVMVTAERGLNILRQALRERGYIDGQNVELVYRYVQGNTDRMPTLIGELLESKPDVLVVSNTTAIRAAQKASTTVPIVMMTNQDPVALGLVKSLARPGGNTTGVISLTRDVSGKRLEIFKETAPKLNDVGVIWVTPTSLGAGNAMKNYEGAARALKLQLISLQAQRPNPDIDALFHAAEKARVDGVICVTNAVLNQHIKRISDLAIQKRLPLMAEGGDFVEKGALISYAANDADRFIRAATYVDKILKGAKPGELPVEQAMKFDLIVNLITAKQINVRIPQRVLARADQVIR